MSTDPLMDPREYARSTEFRATMLDAQRTLFKPRTITTQQELTLLSQTATDGDEVYVLADAANGVRWRFRYNASSTSQYRWEFVGGPPIFAVVSANESNGATIGTVMDLATVGPSVAVPVGGVYEWTSGASVTTPAAVSTESISFCDATGTAVQSWQFSCFGAVAGTILHTSHPYPLTLTAQQYRLRYSANAANYFWAARMLNVTPVRVG